MSSTKKDKKTGKLEIKNENKDNDKKVKDKEIDNNKVDKVYEPIDYTFDIEKLEFGDTAIFKEIDELERAKEFLYELRDKGALSCRFYFKKDDNYLKFSKYLYEKEIKTKYPFINRNSSDSEQFDEKKDDSSSFTFSTSKDENEQEGNTSLNTPKSEKQEVNTSLNTSTTEKQEVNASLNTSENSFNTAKDTQSSNNSSVVFISSTMGSQAQTPELEKYIKSLPKYGPNPDVKFETFSDQLQAYFELMDLTDNAKSVKLAAYAVSGNKKAKNTFTSTKAEKDQLKDILEHCTKILDGKAKYTDNELIQQANKLVLSDFEDPKQYYQEFLNIKIQGTSDLNEKTLTDAFINGIRPQNIRTSIKLLAKDSLFDNYQSLEKVWEPNNRQQSYSANFARNGRGRGASRGGNFRGFQGQRRFSNPRPTLAGPRAFRPQGGQNRASNPNWRQPTAPRPRVPEGTCNYCFKEGHHRATCRKLARAIRANCMEQGYDYDGQYYYDENVGGSDGNFSHFKVLLGRLEDPFNVRLRNDHKLNVNFDKSRARLSNFDPNFSKPISGVTAPAKKEDKVSIPSVVAAKAEVTEGPLCKKTIYRINFQGTKLVRDNIHLFGPNGSGIWHPIMDGGCERSVISYNIAQKLGLTINTNYNFEVLGINDVPNPNVIGFVDKIDFKIKDSDTKFSFSPIVINQTNIDLAGLDLIYNAGGGGYTTNQLGERCFIFERNKSPKHTSSNIRIRVAEQVKIGPGKMAAIKIDTTKFKNRNFLVESRNADKPFAAIDGYLDKNSERIYIANLSKEKELTLQKDQYVANGYEADLQEMEKLGEISQQKSTKLEEKEVDIKIEQKLKHITDNKIRQKMKLLLKKYIHIFDIGSNGVGKYPYPVSINPTGKNLDVKQGKRRSFNPNTWSKINTELDKLEVMDLIEDCPYPMVSPANLVAAKRKGTDRIRLCVDYVRLNEALVHNFFPLPTHDELLANFSNNDYPNSCMVKLDVSNCFHNFPLAEADRSATAFYTERGVKQWKVLPFGIKSAPGIVQHAMNSIVFSQMGLDPSTFKAVFIDDLLFKMKSPEFCPDEIETIFKTLNQYGLILKFEKCEFITKKTEYMGTNLSIEENDVKIKPNPKNIEALRDAVEPYDEKSLRGWIGMINWISKFLPNIHVELGPMYDIIRKLSNNKDKKFKDFWTEDYQNLYKSIQREVSDPKTLSIPNFSAPFFLELDSCGHGMGGICYQKSGDDKRIIGFASKALTKEALSYDNIHRETACAYWGIEKFSPFFSCSPHTTTVYTDNRVTSYIRSATSPKLRRWRSVLDSYNIELVHKPGEKMCVSDALSRLIRSPKSGSYEPDLSDEVLEEVVIAHAKSYIANVASSDVGLELFQLHQKYFHCSADRLSTLSGQPRAVCAKIVDQCFTCNSKDKVKETKQVLGTISDPKEKNHTWFFDFVFSPNGGKYLSILDRSTRFFMLSKVDNREHKGVIKRLNFEFSRLGMPKVLIGDREFISKKLVDFCEECGVILKPLPRESPFLNCVERHHQELKKIAIKNNCDFETAVPVLNNLPFSKGPPGVKLKHLTPAELFFKNDKRLIGLVCDFLEAESNKRSLRSEELRGKNITRFERNFSVGDIVKFNMSNYVGWGKITEKKGSKIYIVERIDKNGTHELHAQQMELVKITETFLRRMLE